MAHRDEAIAALDTLLVLGTETLTLSEFIGAMLTLEATNEALLTRLVREARKAAFKGGQTDHTAAMLRYVKVKWVIRDKLPQWRAIGRGELVEITDVFNNGADGEHDESNP